MCSKDGECLISLAPVHIEGRIFKILLYKRHGLTVDFHLYCVGLFVKPTAFPFELPVIRVQNFLCLILANWFPFEL